jgi:hypothetical protein
MDNIRQNTRLNHISRTTVKMVELWT